MPTDSTEQLTRPEITPSPSAWQLAQRAIERAERTGEKTILVMSFTAPAGDPLAWLSHQSAVPSVYWRSRDGWEYAGIGAVHALGGHGQHAMREIANEAAIFMRENVVTEKCPVARRPRFFGGFAFDPGRDLDPEWAAAGLGDAALILPEALYIRRDTQSYFYFAFPVTARTTPDDLVARLAFCNEQYWHGFNETMADQHAAHVAVPDDSRGRDAWMKKATGIIARIEAHAVDKIVLARRARIHFSSSTDSISDPWVTLAALRAFDPACYQFGCHLAEGGAFVSASPERLFHIDGRHLDSEAVAGTMPRGVSADSDKVQAERLLASAKDQLEHRFVIDAIHDALAWMAADPDQTTVSELDVIPLRTMQHLRSTISVDLRSEVTIGGVLASLHPTPAVAGVPRQSALETIRESESDSRGWYGGPVGWIGADAAEFAVGIRSALVARDHLWAYAGAGLVQGSKAEDEWQETQDKLRAFQSAINSPRLTP